MEGGRTGSITIDKIPLDAWCGSNRSRNGGSSEFPGIAGSLETSWTIMVGGGGEETFYEVFWNYMRQDAFMSLEFLMVLPSLIE